MRADKQRPTAAHFIDGNLRGQLFPYLQQQPILTVLTYLFINGGEGNPFNFLVFSRVMCFYSNSFHFVISVFFTYAFQ